MSYTYSYGTCNFIHPIEIGNKKLVERKWIEVSDGNLKIDLAPLPGLHTESLEEALEDFTSEEYRTPSALFVKECFEFFTSIQPVEVESNHLLYIDMTTGPEDLAKSLRDGAVYKIKIGRNELISESSWLKRLIDLTPKTIKIRLDGNRSFTAESLNQYLNLFDLSKVQYLEEPLKNVGDWERLDRINELSLALDESISLRKSFSYARYLVAKPTFNISLRNTLKELALENQEVIVSNAFDPPNNLAILKMIASESDQVCGLDTLKYFDLASLKVSPL